MITRFYVGLDLGSDRDSAALAVLERMDSRGEWDGTPFEIRKIDAHRVRHLERLPAGTPYQEVVERVSAVMRTLAGAGTCELIVDATRVEGPVVDLLRLEGLDCTIREVVVTGGYGESESDGLYRVSMWDLVTGLEMLLHDRALKIAMGLEWGPALLKEMSEMRRKETPGEIDELGFNGGGMHRPLVFAVALAGWGAERWYPVEMSGGHGVN